MLQKALSRKVYLFLIFSMSATLISADRKPIDDDLKRFLDLLDKYENTPNDIVFLLEESGYIGQQGFNQLKSLAKLIVQRFSVSAMHSRIAVVTFSTAAITHVNYITNPRASNMCTLLKQIDNIGYVGEYRHTMKAMQRAENILADAPPDSEKIIILLTDGPSNPGFSPVSVSDRLKSNDVVIFVVGTEDVNEADVNEVATSADHVYILHNFDYLNNLKLQDVFIDLAKNSSYCDSRCDEHASCYCETRTEKPKCICNAGYYGNEGTKGKCRKCPKGTYKAEPKHADCTDCPPDSSTLVEGSTDMADCLCNLGYEKAGNTCLRISTEDEGVSEQTEPPLHSTTRQDFECITASLAEGNYNAGDEVDASLPLLGKLIRSLPRNKRLPKIMELLNNVYNYTVSNKGN